MQKTKVYFGILTAILAFNASANDIHAELALLKKQMSGMQNKIATLEKLIAQSEGQPIAKPEQNKLALEPEKESAVKISAAKKTKDIKLYASLRPTFGYHDVNDEKNWDVKDALSNAGFKSHYNFQEGWTAILHGEWSIDLSNNADFGKARQVYVAMDTPYGKVGIGKQRPVQYLFIAEYNDIFDHANSPYAYDLESPFFVNNMLTYQIQQGDFTWMMAGQFDGEQGDNNSDLFNGGVSYDNDNLHIGLTYLQQSIFDGDTELGDDKVFAGSVAYTFDNDLYMALAYQGKDYERNGFSDRDGHTFDFAIAYPLAPNYKIKAGYFDFEDGTNNLLTKNHDGGNLTLEWIPNDDVKFHIEYLYRNFEQLPDFSSISIGFRYDYAQTWKF